jgi:hypothetical protein
LNGYITLLETIGEGATCKVKHVVAEVIEDSKPDVKYEQHLALKVYSKY